MTKTELIDLAKECGMMPLPVSRNEAMHVMSDYQLAAYTNAVIAMCASVAMDMPLKTEKEHNQYRATDDSKAMAWDINHAIRAMRVEE